MSWQHVNVCICTAVVSILLLPAFATCGSEDDYAVGDEVVAIQNADLRVPGKVMGQVNRGDVAVIERIEGKWLWIRRSEIRGWIGSPVFSPDGQRVVYAARRGERWFVVDNGSKGRAYDEIGESFFRFAGNGRRMAYLWLLVDGLNTLPEPVRAGDSGKPSRRGLVYLPAQRVHLDQARAWRLSPRPNGTEAKAHSIRGFYQRIGEKPDGSALWEWETFKVVDACRNDPEPGGGRSLDTAPDVAADFVRGLQSPPEGMVVLSSCTARAGSLPDSIASAE